MSIFVLFLTLFFYFKGDKFIIANLKNAKKKKCKNKFARKSTRLQGFIYLEGCIISFLKVNYYKIPLYIRSMWCSVCFICLFGCCLLGVIAKEGKCVYSLFKGDVYCVYCDFVF